MLATQTMRSYDSADVAFGDPISALLRLLSQLDGLLATALAEFQSSEEAANADSFHGLYTRRAEVEPLLAPSAARLIERPDLTEMGDGSRMADLAETFGLSPFEADLLLIALAPELDRRYERLYGYLQNDMTRRRATVDFALGLLCPTLATRLAARHCLAPSAALLRHGLLRLLDDPADHQPALLLKELKADQRIVDFLLGNDQIDMRLDGIVHLATPSRRLSELVLPTETRRQFERLATSTGSGIICTLRGPSGAGKETIAAAVGAALGLRLLVIDGARVGAGSEFVSTLRLILRELRLQNATLYWQGFDTLLDDSRAAERALLLRELAGVPAPSFLACNQNWEPSDPPSGLTYLRIEVPTPSAADRKQLWAHMLEPRTENQEPRTENRELRTDILRSWHVTEIDLDALANTFRLTPGQIRDVAATARGLAWLRDAPIGLAELEAACRMQSSPRLAELARIVAPHHTWEDLVLPDERKRQLRELCAHLRHRARVHEEWGFGRKLALGSGLAALFAGPSGTGKTMAASIIAGELGLDLYAIDLASVVSKYIGETEKNLGRIFDEAERSNAVLFFDEADALFGKRSEAKDAHDRYANLEVAYLLQRIETYTGVVILATNLRKNMDDAFVRRMHFIVEFPFPAERERRQIWERIWPANTPRDPALDLGLLAKRCEIAGGNIRNVALAAAFLAAANGGIVTMEHLAHAARREYQKIGKVVGENEFR